LSFGGHPVRAVVNPLKPNLPPERQELSRAIRVVYTTTHYTVQHDAGILHPQHPTGFFVDTPIDATEDTRCLAAVSRHLLIKPHASVATVKVKRLQDFLLGFDPNQLAWLQVEPRRRCPADSTPLDKTPTQAALDQ